MFLGKFQNQKICIIIYIYMIYIYIYIYSPYHGKVEGDNRLASSEISAEHP